MKQFTQVDIFFAAVIIIIVLYIMCDYMCSDTVEHLSSGTNILTGTTPGFVSGKWKLTFYDDFSKDLSNWSMMEGLDTLSNSCSMYSKDNVTTGPDGLKITVGPTVTDATKCKGYGPDGKKVNPDTCIKSGRLYSNFKQKYGLFIWTAKVPRGHNLWPALWLTATGSGIHWPQTGEFDVMEVVDDKKSRSYFTTRVMVPISADESTYWGVSVPPDDQPDDQVHVESDWWDQYHTFAVNWYKSGNDTMYDVYLDISVIDGKIVDIRTGMPATPVKSYNLGDLVSKWQSYKMPGGGNYKLASAGSIDQWVKPMSMVCNIAVGGWWGGPCGGEKCSSCNNTSAEMIIKNVQVWEQ